VGEQQPDDLVTALTQALTVHQQAASTGDEVMCRCDRRWRPNGVQAEHQARAVLARADLILPAADVIPKQDVEWDWGVRFPDGSVSYTDGTRSEGWCRDYVSAAATNGRGGRAVVRRSVVRSPWEVAPDPRALVAGGEA